MSNNTAAVDYTPAATIADAKAALAKSFRAYRTMEKRHTADDSTRTTDCAVAVLGALQTGYLVDGRNAGEGTDTITKSGLATQYGVSGGQVTFWIRLAKAIRAGVVPGDAVWTAIATGEGGRAAKRSDVGKAIDTAKSPADIVKAMQAAGLDPITGKRLPGSNASGPRKSSQGDSPEDGHAVTETDPLKAGKALLVELSRVCGSLPDTDAGREVWTVLRTGLLSLGRKYDTTLMAEDERVFGPGRKAPVASKGTAKKATSKAA